MTKEYSGGSVSYYQVHIDDPTTAGRPAYTAECNDIIEALGLTPAEANVFKAIWRTGAERTLGKCKAGNNAVYDAEKIVFFSQRVLVQARRKVKVETPIAIATRGCEVPTGYVPHQPHMATLSKE